MNRACEVRMSGCAGRAAHTHHRKMRSQGGTDEPSNTLAVCWRCHSQIHAYPAVSYENGWLVKSWDNPALVPVRSLCVVCGDGRCDGEFCPKEAA